jgi:rhodanese-related sulfurtransferase
MSLPIVALVLAALALLIAWSARKRLVSMQDALESLRRGTTIREADEEELKQSVDGLRRLLALMAGGKPVDADMVKENRLFRNARPEEIQGELDAGGKPYVLDVRTDQEWQGGHIPGATHIPVDDIKRRLSEVARDGRKMYVICAGGGRSAAAADYLANRGYLNVHNVEGGMGAWRGDVVRD